MNISMIFLNWRMAMLWSRIVGETTNTEDSAKIAVVSLAGVLVNLAIGALDDVQAKDTVLLLDSQDSTEFDELLVAFNTLPDANSKITFANLFFVMSAFAELGETKVNAKLYESAEFYRNHVGTIINFLGGDGSSIIKTIEDPTPPDP